MWITSGVLGDGAPAVGGKPGIRPGTVQSESPDYRVRQRRAPPRSRSLGAVF